MPLLTPPRFSTLRTALRSAPVSAPPLEGDRHLTRALAVASSTRMRRTGTAQHARRVGQLASITALALGHSAALAGRIRMAALVHDVGKAWIPARVLLKPSALDADEWLLIEAHPITGAGMLAGPELADIASWILNHHERPDGRGYPYGRMLADTPAEARIISVCDAFDAMTSSRPNSPALTVGAALDELAVHAGTQFDADVVAAFREAVSAARDRVHRA